MAGPAKYHKTFASYPLSYPAQEAAVMEMGAEIEQLRTDLSLRDQTARDRKGIIAELEAEIERLRATAEEDARLRQACLELRDEARTESKRLRAALHWTAQNCLDQSCVKRAMEALEGGNMTVTIHGDCGIEHPSIEDWQRCPACTKILRERTARAVEQEAPVARLPSIPGTAGG